MSKVNDERFPSADAPLHTAQQEAESSSSLPEERESLWWLTAAPALWAVHFLSCYAMVALWCGKAVEQDLKLGPVRWVAVVLTAGALFGIYRVGRNSHRRHAFRSAPIPHDFDTPEDRHRFLGFAGLLLSVLSAIAVVYETLPFALVSTCW